MRKNASGAAKRKWKAEKLHAAEASKLRKLTAFFV